MRRALAIFAKVPVAGLVKTRLASVLTAEGAAALYRGFLVDTVALALKVRRCQIHLFYTPREALSVLQDMLKQPVELLPQSSGDLGSRMNGVFRDLFTKSFKSIILIGGDLPTLPLNRLTMAFSALERRDVVLGPSVDGGYYLIGLRAPQPELFEGVAWSTNQVLGQTIERVHRLGLEVQCLEPWYDVDTIEGLGFLVSHLRLLLACRCPDLPRQTVDVLHQLGLLRGGAEEIAS